jgi:hypothetical protein
MTALKKITFIERKEKEIAHSRKIKKLKSHIIISNKKILQNAITFVYFSNHFCIAYYVMKLVNVMCTI